MSEKASVLMAMSGGLDSSVAALILQQQGFNVIGITMKVWSYDRTLACSNHAACCDTDAISDAQNLAVTLNIPHYVVDLQKEFEEFVINNFISEYLKGRTPNPCVNCNIHLKWHALLKKADQLGCDYIATGHYAKIREEKGNYILSKGLDETKEQSYVLWGLTQEQLKRTLFPLSDLHKSEIRKIAQDHGFTRIANKRESYDICFIPNGDYREFLNLRVEGLRERFKNGDFLNAKGEKIGKHKGFPYYTIGQRKGLEIALGKPQYVTKINAETNEITLGDTEDLLTETLTSSHFNLMQSLEEHKIYEVKIRYKTKASPAMVHLENNLLKVKFLEPVSAVTSGQSAVIYAGDDVLGGGIID